VVEILELRDDRLTLLEQEVADLTRRVVGQEWLREQVDAMRDELRAAMKEVVEVRKLTLTVMKKRKEMAEVMYEMRSAAREAKSMADDYIGLAEKYRRGASAVLSEDVSQMKRDIANLRAIAAYNERRR